MSLRARFWAVSVAALLGLALTLALGFWQLGRAQQKLALQAAVETRGRQVPLAAPDLQAPLADLLHRPVRLRGTWSATHTVFLDNRQMRGRPGFYVVTPLRLEGSDAAVLVQRGWAPRDFIDRERLPAIDTPAGVVEVAGRIAPPPAKLYEFAGAAVGPIRQNLELARFRQETGLRLLDPSVQQVGPASQGLLRDWPAAATGVDKHYGYTFQWWAMSGLIVILYAWFQIIVPRRRLRHDAPPA